MVSSVRWNDEQIEGSRPYIGFVRLGDVHARQIISDNRHPSERWTPF
jgi:hypothetical protein